MKIAVYLHSLVEGGAEKVMAEFCNYLCTCSSNEVTLYLSEGDGEYLPLLNKSLHVVCFNKRKALSSFLPLFFHLRADKPDYLYSTLTNPDIICILIGRFLKIRTIIRMANTITEYSKSKKKLGEKVGYLISRHIYKYAYKCIAISNIVKNDLLKYTNLSEKQIEVIYNPIITFEDTEDEIDLDVEYFHVAFVSRLTLQKNLRTISKIVEHFINSNSKIIFHFFGSGEDKYILDNIHEKYPNSRNVLRLHGFHLSYYSHVKKMNLFIHLPIWEGLGNSVLEVYNSGIPMILSNAETGYSELVKPEFPNIHYFHPTKDTFPIIELINKYLEGDIKISTTREKITISKEYVYGRYLELAK